MSLIDYRKNGTYQPSLYPLYHWTGCISLLSIIAWRNFAAALAEGTPKIWFFGVPSIKAAAKFRQATMLNKEM